MNKLAKTLLALAFTCSLSLGLNLEAHAAPVDVHSATLAKELAVVEGTNTPSMTFDFLVEKVKYNNSSSPADVAYMPTLGTAGVVSTAFSGNELPLGPAAGGVMRYRLESREFVAAAHWPSTGVYEYLIKEKTDVNPILNTAHQFMEYSQAEYAMSVFIREYQASDIIPPGFSVGDCYVYAINTVLMVDDDGAVVNGGAGAKVDASPGSSAVTFTNKYMKDNGTGKPTDPTLAVSSSVSGDMGSLVWPFEYSLNLHIPSLVPSGIKPFYTAYVMDKDGTTVLDPEAAGPLSVGTDSAGRKMIQFAPGVATNFKLQNGQYLSFIDVPVGATYTLSTPGESDYTTTGTVTSNGLQGMVATGVLGAGLALPDGIVYTDIPLVGETVNRVDFVHAYDLTPPAGIRTESVPFYLVILLATSSLAAFVLIKRRKYASESRSKYCGDTSPWK